MFQSNYFVWTWKVNANSGLVFYIFYFVLYYFFALTGIWLHCNVYNYIKLFMYIRNMCSLPLMKKNSFKKQLKTYVSNCSSCPIPCLICFMWSPSGSEPDDCSFFILLKAALISFVKISFCSNSLASDISFSSPVSQESPIYLHSLYDIKFIEIVSFFFLCSDFSMHPASIALYLKIFTPTSLHLFSHDAFLIFKSFASLNLM